MANFIHTALNAVKKNSPAILTGVAVAGTIGAVVSAIKCKPKYDRLITEKKEAAEKEGTEVTKKDILVTTFKAYWPTLILIAVSASAAIGGQIINAQRVAGAMATATATKKLYDDYTEAAEKKLKPKQVEEISDEIAKKRMEEGTKGLKKASKIAQQKSVEGPKDGWQLLYDCWLGKPFWGDPDQIRRKWVSFCDAYFNHGDSDIRLESMYMELDIPHEKVPIIKNSGWNLGRSMPEWKWVPVQIPEGEYAGELIWGFQWRTNDEPTDVIY